MQMTPCDSKLTDAKQRRGWPGADAAGSWTGGVCVCVCPGADAAGSWTGGVCVCVCVSWG